MQSGWRLEIAPRGRCGARRRPASTRPRRRTTGRRPSNPDFQSADPGLQTRPRGGGCSRFVGVEVDGTNIEDLGGKGKATGFAGDVLKLVSGTAFAQALGILASPLLTRLYGPEAFGVAALFASIAGIIGVVVCLRYELSIVLPESDEEAANLFASSLVIAFLMSLLMVPAVWLGGPWIVRLLNAPELGPYLWLLPPVVFFGGLSLGHPGLNYWATRFRHFGRLSMTQVINSLLTTGAQLGVGYAGYATAGGLIGSSAAGSIVSTLVLAVRTWRDDWRLLRQSVHWRGMLAGLKRHYKFPFYGTGSGLMNSVSWQLPAFLLSAFFSPEVAGYYALGTRLLRLPMNLVGNSIAQVFLQRVSRARAEGTLATVVESTFRRLVTLGLFPFLLLTIIGRDLFVVAFGERWAEAGVYTQILSVWTFFWFVSSPLSALLVVLERQEIGLAFDTAILATRLVSLIIGGLMQSPRVGLFLFAASGVLTYGGVSLLVLRLAGVPLYRNLRTILASIMVFAPVGAALVALKAWRVHPWVQLGLAALSIAAYFLHLTARDPELRGYLAQLRGKQAAIDE